MACPTRTGRAEKGAGYSFWASHRESLEEATPTNPVLPMSREQGSPYWVARQRTQKGLRESSGPELAGRARPRRPWLSAPPWERFPFPSHRGPSSPVGPVLVQPTLPGHTAACCTRRARLLEVYSLPTLTAGPLGLPKLPRGSGPVTLKTVRSLNSLVWGNAALS